MIRGMPILSADTRPVVFETPHGERVTEWIGRARNGEEVRHSLAEIRVLPGKSSLRHHHPEVEESYLILEGVAWMELGEEQQAIQAGHAVLIPPGVTHKISNHGETLLRMMVTCAPAWTPDCSVFLERWDEERREVVPVDPNGS